MPIKDRYKTYLEIDDKIDTLIDNDEEIPSSLYDELEAVIILVKEHPDYKTFFPDRIYYPPLNIIKEFFLYLITMYSYNTMRNITLDIIRYNTYLYVESCDIFSEIRRNIVKNGWNCDHLKKNNIREQILENIIYAELN